MLITSERLSTFTKFRVVACFVDIVHSQKHSAAEFHHSSRPYNALPDLVSGRAERIAGRGVSGSGLCETGMLRQLFA